MSEPTPPPFSAESSVLRDRGAFPVFVVRRPRPRYWLHALLLALTIFTTLVVGARFQFYFEQNQPAFSAEETALSEFPILWVLHEPANLLLGIPFAASLLGILGAHEMGHYVCCRRYGVHATLPFFIPAPTLIGTLGAVIRIRSRIPSRHALFDIGISGPIAGFVVAVPVMMIGLANSRAYPGAVPANGLELGFPLIFTLGHLLRLPAPLNQLLLHPVAIAAWFGMFATALNLLPGGQLDGGHMTWSLSPQWHRWVSFALIAGLIPLAIFGFLGWVVWAIFVRVSLRHPQVPAWPPLDGRRKLLAAAAFAMLVLTFTPQPFPGFSLLDIIEQFRHGG